MKIDIDYVVPMVFPDDTKWRHDYMTATRCYRDDGSAATSPRFRSWGTEELLIRCIRKNLPWVRTIYIILARRSQVQPWMEEMVAVTQQHTGQQDASGVAVTQQHTGQPNVRVVFHRDIMPKEVLPTFNSRAIEMYLHRIPGLSEYFLYGNDDMFPMGEMGVEEFFRAATRPQGDGAAAKPLPTLNGMLPCLHYTKKAFNSKNAFHLACMNGMNFVAGEFGQRFEDYWLRVGHNVVPMVKATCEMFWDRWPKKMQESVTRFRMPQNYNQYIYSWWQILSGQYVEHRPARRYLSVDTPIDDIREAIRTADGLLCINDNNSVSDITNLAAIVRSEIQKRL